MYIGTQYAAKKLGVSQNVIRKLVQKGHLKDYGQTKEGGKRHEMILDRDDVLQFQRSHVRNGRKFVPTAADIGEGPAKPAKITRTARRAAQTVTDKPEREVVSVQTEAGFRPGVRTGTANGPKGIFDRLDRVENKLDRLLKVWIEE